MTAVREAPARTDPAPPARTRQLAAAARWARRAPLLPALIFTIVVTQLPFVATLVISLMRWNSLDPANRGFAGLDNYAAVFTDPDLRGAIGVTVLLTTHILEEAEGASRVAILDRGLGRPLQQVEVEIEEMRPESALFKTRLIHAGRRYATGRIVLAFDPQQILLAMIIDGEGLQTLCHCRVS